MKNTDRISTSWIQIMGMLLLLITPYFISAQLHNSCESLSSCHIYYNTFHEAELIDCWPCETCSQTSCLSNSTSETIVYSFVALSSHVEITLYQPGPPSNDYANFGAGIFPEDWSECIVQGYACDASPGEFTLETFDLVQGKIYNLYIDGCPFDSEGDVHFEFGEALFESQPLIEEMEFGVVEQCGIPYSEEFKYCQGTQVYFEPFFNEQVSTDFLEGKVFVFSGQTQEQDFQFVVEYPFERAVITLEDPGTYSFCLVTFGEYQETEECVPLFYPEEFCFDEVITISQDNVIYSEEFILCGQNLEAGFLPPSPWNGGVISEPGIHESLAYPNCECEYIQQINVVQLDSEIGEVTIDLCPQDLPYTMFDGEFVIQPGDNYVADLILIEEASVQSGYYQTNCDSLFELTVNYLDDPDVCNKCELAYSVSLSNLVTCLPFDNSELDLSNQNNHAELVNGTEYVMDRFEEDLFALKFDGENDFVSVDHTEQFLDDQYSMSFWFKKDEDTFDDQNPKEALVYKGLEGSSNKSFSITLERHFADKMLLDFTINAGPYEKSIRYGAFEYDIWYHIAVINDFGNMKLIIDGQVAETNFSNLNNQFNGEDLLMGVMPTTTGYKGYFKGQMDEFRYWTRTLSDREGYLLFRPEAEFHVTSTFEMTCCDSVEFFGNQYDFTNPIDTVTIAGASPTGEDSLYILNIKIEDSIPEIRLDLIPDDIQLEVSTICGHDCAAIAEWVDPSFEAYSDNCGIASIEQSHYSPLEIDESMPSIEVVYRVTDLCGQMTEASFMIDLSCTQTEVPEIPEPSDFLTIADTLCVENGLSICLGKQVEWHLLTSSIGGQGLVEYPVDFIADWDFEISGPTGIETLLFQNQPPPAVVFEPSEAGQY